MPQTCPRCIGTTPSLGSGPFFISCSHTLMGLPLSSIAWWDAGTRTVHMLAPGNICSHISVACVPHLTGWSHVLSIALGGPRE